MWTTSLLLSTNLSFRAVNTIFGDYTIYRGISQIEPHKTQALARVILIRLVPRHLPLKGKAYIPTNSNLQDYAQKSVATLVYDSFESFLEFHSRIRWHMVKLVAKTLVDEFIQ